jgi:hypothetical protein
VELPPGARPVLTGPDFLARQLAARVSDRQHAWLLRRPKAIRRSYLEEVIDGGGSQERWMLLQHDDVCSSYVEQVLEHEITPDRQAMWLLRQPRRVRATYVEDVIDAASASPDSSSALARPRSS